MWLELYTAEKLRELEEERLGEGLEAWGAGRPEGAADGESA